LLRKFGGDANTVTRRQKWFNHAMNQMKVVPPKRARYEVRVLRVFITGLGVVSSIGLGKDAFFASLAEGKSGISPVESCDASNRGRALAGEV
jgi:hypothetical protein